MPSYRGHLIGGMVTYIALVQFIKYSNPTVDIVIQGMLFCLLGSLFPDVDVKSKGQKIFYILLLSFLCYCLWINRWDLFVICSLLGTMPLLVKHRGIFHQIWFLFSLTLIIVLVTKSWYRNHEMLFLANGSFFFAGCLSHVLLDRFVSKLKRYIK